MLDIRSTSGELGRKDLSTLAVAILIDHVAEDLTELGVQHSGSSGIIKIVFVIMVYQGSDSRNLALQNMGFGRQLETWFSGQIPDGVLDNLGT